MNATTSRVELVQQNKCGDWWRSKCKRFDLYETAEGWVGYDDPHRLLPVEFETLDEAKLWCQKRAEGRA